MRKMVYDNLILEHRKKIRVEERKSRSGRVRISRLDIRFNNIIDSQSSVVNLFEGWDDRGLRNWYDFEKWHEVSMEEYDI